MKNMLLFADTRTGSSSLLFLIRKAYDAVRRSRGDITTPEENKTEKFNSIKLSTADDKLLECVGEPWHPGSINYFFGKKIYNELYQGKIKDSYLPLQNEPWEIIRDVHTNVYRISHGAKHIWSHLRPAINLTLLQKSIKEGHSIIFLERRNVGAKCLSHMLAQQTDQWGLYTTEPTFEAIDLDRLKHLIDRYYRTKTDYFNFLEYYNNVYHLVYEDLYMLDSDADKLEIVYDILNFLGIEDKEIIHSVDGGPSPAGMAGSMSKDRKINTTARLQTIPNIKDVCRVIKKHCNGEMLLPEW